MKTLTIQSLIAGLLLLHTGCGSPRVAMGSGDLQDTQVQKGRALFSQHCSPCHPGGAGGLGPSLNEKPLPAFLIRTQVRRGFGAMPAFDKHRLTPGELDEIIAYMKAMRHSPKT